MQVTTKKRKAYNTRLQDSVVARVNSDCADWEKSNANEFTHGTHDRNLNPATPAAWGDLRHDGNPNAGPNTQYCANLGHKKDDESGLTYMRARYYEPWTGRFISEDPARDGWNWFVYGDNNPIANVDSTGRSSVPSLIELANDIIRWLRTQGVSVPAIIEGSAKIAGAAATILAYWKLANVSAIVARIFFQFTGSLMTGPVPWLSAGAFVLGTVSAVTSICARIAVIFVMRDLIVELMAMPEE